MVGSSRKIAPAFSVTVTFGVATIHQCDCSGCEEGGCGFDVCCALTLHIRWYAIMSGQQEGMTS